MFIFELHGKAVPQKQTQFTKGGIAYDPSKKQKIFYQWQMKPYAPIEPLSGPVKVDLTFYLPIPKSASSIRKRQMLSHVILPVKRPDVDNLAYLITNAMKQIFYVDDSQIVDLCMHKRYGEEPKTVVKIVAIEQIAPITGDVCA